MTYVQLILGFLAIVAAWDIGRRFVATRRLSAELAQAVKNSEQVARTALAGGSKEIDALTIRLGKLEEKVQGVKNHVEGLKPARPWGGARVPRIG